LDGPLLEVASNENPLGDGAILRGVKAILPAAVLVMLGAALTLQAAVRGYRRVLRVDNREEESTCFMSVRNPEA